jgi:hypothetical protein
MANIEAGGFRKFHLDTMFEENRVVLLEKDIKRASENAAGSAI